MILYYHATSFITERIRIAVTFMNPYFQSVFLIAFYKLIKFQFKYNTGDVIKGVFTL